MQDVSNEDNRPKRSKKRPESGIHGKHYERKVLGLIALKCFLDKDIQDFWILSNPEEVSKFDDIILSTEHSNGDKKIFMLQLKHKKQGTSRPIVADKLDGTDKDLSLIMYEDAFSEIIKKTKFLEDNISEKTRMFFIMFNNCKINYEKENDNISFEVSNECFKFIDTSSEPTNVFKIINKTGKYNQDFIDKFYFYSEQLNEELLNDEIGKLLGITDDITKEIVSFFYSWVESRECIKLTKLHVKMKLLDILTRELQPPSELKNISKSVLINVMNKFEVTIVEQEKSSIMVWQDILYQMQDFCDDSDLVLSTWESNCVSKSVEQKLFSYFENREAYCKNITIRLVYVCMIIQRKVPLLIITSNRFFESFRNKLLVALDIFSVVFKVNKGDLNFLNVRVFQNLGAVSNRLYSKNSRKQKISFQGKTDIALYNLIKKNPDLKETMSVDNYIEFFNATCVVGEKNHPPVYYVNREINVPLLKNEILNEDEAMIFVLFSSRTKIKDCGIIDFRYYLFQPFDEIYLRPRYVIGISEFKSGIVDLIQKYSDDRTYYLLSYIDENYFSLMHTNGSIENIRNYLTYIPKKDIESIDMYKNCCTNIICNNAGMGKSVFLNFINSKLLPDEWVVHMDLKKHSIKKIKSLEDLINFSFECQTENVRETLRNFLLTLYKNMKHKVIWLIDDYEEVSQPDLLELFKDASKQEYRIWIVARPSLKLELENVFGVFSMELTEFNGEDQVTFIKKYLKYKNKNDDHIEKVMKAINNIRHLLEDSFIGICQQTMMLTEIFLNYEESWNEHEWHIHDIYEKFIELKTSDSCELHFYIRTLSKLALKVFFKNEAFKKVFDLEEFAEDVIFFRRKYTKDYFITEFGEDDAPIFSHRTYAEFLAARWLLQTAKKQIRGETPSDISGIFRMLYMKELNAIRLFLDNMLTETLPLHSAIVNRENYKIKNMINDSAFLFTTDLLGRSIFHLLSSYGTYFDVGATKEFNTVIRNIDIHSQVVTNGRDIMLMPVDSMTPKVSNTNILNHILDSINLWSIMKLSCLEDSLLKLNCFEYALLSGSLLELDILLNLTSRLPKPSTHVKYFLLYYSIKNEYHHILSMLDVQGLNNVKIGDTGMSFLHLAVTSKNLKAVEKLLKTHSLRDWGVDNKENTPLHLACGQKDGYLLDYFFMLKDMDSNFLNKKNINGQSHLYCLARQGHTKWIKRIIEKFPGIDIQAECRNGNTPFIISIIFNRVEVAELLRSYGAKVNHTNKKKVTALHYAASKGFWKCVETLLQWNADVNQNDKYGMTALMKACDWGHKDVVELLLINKANLHLRDKKKMTALHYASSKGFLECVKLLLQRKSAVDRQNKSGMTPLMKACSRGHTDVVQLLLANKANVRSRDKKRRTALHYAVEKEHIEIIKLLLEFNASVDSENEEGDSPLVIACRSGFKEAVKLFVLNNKPCVDKLFAKIYLEDKYKDCLDTLFEITSQWRMPIQISVGVGSYFHKEIVIHF